MNKEQIVRLILGIVVCIVGLCIWFTDFIIFVAIGALVSSVAGLFGITGMPLFGLHVLVLVLVFNIMISILFLGYVVLVLGLGIILG